MLVGFGDFGLDPLPADPAQEVQRQALRQGIATMGPQMDSLGLDYQHALGDNKVYLLTTERYFDTQKYMHLGIGALAGTVLSLSVMYIVFHD